MKTLMFSLHLIYTVCSYGNKDMKYNKKVATQIIRNLENIKEHGACELILFYMLDSRNANFR